MSFINKQRANSFLTGDINHIRSEAQNQMEVTPMYPVMLLEQRDEPFNDDKYVFEVKFDGIRAIYAYTNNKVELFTRHGTNITKRFPEISVTQHVMKECVLDGELIVYNPQTLRDDFSLVMNRFSLTNADKIKFAVLEYPSTFVVFDVLEIEGKSLVEKPLFQRKNILEDLVVKSANVQFATSIRGEGEVLFEAVKEQRMEGIVAKAINSNYLPGRRSSNGEWIKIINHVFRQTYIFGIRKGEYGVYIARDIGGAIKPIGCIEVGISPKVRLEIHKRIQGTIISESPNALYVEPKVKILVKAREELENGNLRIPLFDSFLD